VQPPNRTTELHPSKHAHCYDVISTEYVLTPASHLVKCALEVHKMLSNLLQHAVDLRYSRIHTHTHTLVHMRTQHTRRPSRTCELALVRHGRPAVHHTHHHTSQPTNQHRGVLFASFAEHTHARTRTPSTQHSAWHCRHHTPMATPRSPPSLASMCLTRAAETLHKDHVRAFLLKLFASFFLSPPPGLRSLASPTALAYQAIARINQPARAPERLYIQPDRNSRRFARVRLCVSHHKHRTACLAAMHVDDSIKPLTRDNTWDSIVTTFMAAARAVGAAVISSDSKNHVQILAAQGINVSTANPNSGSICSI
jgi:hypothetical protein